jgi:peptidoglycan/xylan/chitin deacetylase (PgdA/CDA1 family)
MFSGVAMPTVKVVLTFDDGPHNSALGQNRSVRIATQLNGLGIAAAYFIQSAVPYRMGSKSGVDAVKAINGPVGSATHVIEIHTGSRDDHVKHWKRWKAGQLQTDLTAAKSDIQSACGRVPKSVRAVGLELCNPADTVAVQNQTKAAILQTYQDVALRHIGINLNSFDNTSQKWKGAKRKRRPAAAEVVRCPWLAEPHSDLPSMAICPRPRAWCRACVHS